MGPVMCIVKSVEERNQNLVIRESWYTSEVVGMVTAVTPAFMNNTVCSP